MVAITPDKTDVTIALGVVVHVDRDGIVETAQLGHIAEVGLYRQIAMVVPLVLEEHLQLIRQSLGTTVTHVEGVEQRRNAYGGPSGIEAVAVGKIIADIVPEEVFDFTDEPHLVRAVFFFFLLQYFVLFLVAEIDAVLLGRQREWPQAVYEALVHLATNGVGERPGLVVDGGKVALNLVKQEFELRLGIAARRNTVDTRSIHRSQGLELHHVEIALVGNGVNATRPEVNDGTPLDQLGIPDAWLEGDNGLVVVSVGRLVFVVSTVGAMEGRQQTVAIDLLAINVGGHRLKKSRHGSAVMGNGAGLDLRHIMIVVRAVII